MPSLAGATEWLNSPPLTPAGLRGSVVLVDFWTYTCINWLRTLPYLRAWADKYRDHGLVVLGVHTPEFDVEHDLDNVRRAVKDLGGDYPVAVDNHYWPALYLVDAHGQIRHHQFGEGGYQQSEMILQQLLVEAGAEGIGQDLVVVDPGGVETAADRDSLWSPENYLGYARTENFASPDGAVLDTPQVYAVPGRLRLNQWALAGAWTVKRQAIGLNAPDAAVPADPPARPYHRAHLPDHLPGSRRPGLRLHLRLAGSGEPRPYRTNLPGRLCLVPGQNQAKDSAGHPRRPGAG